MAPVTAHAETWQTLWMTVFACPDDTGLPCPAVVGHGRTRDPRYQSAGRWRRDEQLVLHVTRAGEGHFQDRDGIHPIHPGEGFLCRVSDPETAYFYPPAGRCDWEWTWIAFSGAGALRLGADLLATGGPVFTLGTNHPLMDRLDGWRHRRERRVGLDRAAAWGLFSEVVAALVACSEQRPTPLVQARRRLMVNPAEAPSVEHLAADLGWTREHFCRRFVAAFGETPSACLRRYRLATARQLLLESSLGVAEIARLCGYGHTTNFIRAVRAHWGVSPGTLRRHESPAANVLR